MNKWNQPWLTELQKAELCGELSIKYFLEEARRIREDKDAEDKAQRNKLRSQYDELVNARNALPLWLRLFTRRPKHPSGSSAWPPYRHFGYTESGIRDLELQEARFKGKKIREELIENALKRELK